MTTQTGSRALRVIAVYKFVKALGLLIVACVAFGVMRTALLDATAMWIEHLPIQNGRNVLQHLLDTATGMSPRRFLAVGIAASAYATLFFIEGIGLWLGKRWAEYLTVFATASLIPFELWELVVHPTLTKAIVLLVNVAIVIYLWYLLRRGASTGAHSKPS